MEIKNPVRSVLFCCFFFFFSWFFGRKLLVKVIQSAVDIGDDASVGGGGMSKTIR